MWQTCGRTQFILIFVCLHRKLPNGKSPDQTFLDLGPVKYEVHVTASTALTYMYNVDSLIVIHITYLLSTLTHGR